MIGFREGDTGAVTVRHRAGSRYTPDCTFTIEPGKGFGGQALLTGRPVRTDDYLSDPASAQEYLGAVGRTRASPPWLCRSRARSAWSGCSTCANRSHRPFTDHDEATLLRLADEAAVAIRNARSSPASERASDAIGRWSRLDPGHPHPPELGHAVRQRGVRAAARLRHTSELVGLDSRTWIAPHELPRIESDRAARLRGDAVPPQYEFQAIQRDGSLI